MLLIDPFRMGDEDDSDEEDDEYSKGRVKNAQRERSGKRRKGPDGTAVVAKGSVGWIHKKKQQRRMRGDHVKNDSKYTGRKRKPGGSHF